MVFNNKVKYSFPIVSSDQSFEKLIRRNKKFKNLKSILQVYENINFDEAITEYHTYRPYAQTTNRQNHTIFIPIHQKNVCTLPSK